MIISIIGQKSKVSYTSDIPWYDVGKYVRLYLTLPRPTWDLTDSPLEEFSNLPRAVSVFHVRASFKQQAGPQKSATVALQGCHAQPRLTGINLRTLTAVKSSRTNLL